MAIYLWDASHYDGTLDLAILGRAKAQGIVGFTHKLGEGLGSADPTAETALAAARDVGMQVIGGYWFNHGNDRPADEVAAFIAEANRHEPWWPEFPGWFWQADLERSSTGLPSPAWAKEFCDRLYDATGRTVIAYASHGMYGNTLTGLGHPLWNANYPSSRRAGFKDLYPGDSYSGWSKYSGQTPVLCQYTSSATIAGLTTCDANAFRGSIDELLTLIGAPVTTAHDPLDDADVSALVHTATIDTPAALLTLIPTLGAKITLQTLLTQTWAAVNRLTTSEAALAVTLAGLPAAIIAALPPAGPGGLTADDVEGAVAHVVSRLGIAVTVTP